MMNISIGWSFGAIWNHYFPRVVRGSKAMDGSKPPNTQKYAVASLGAQRNHFILDVKPTLLGTDVVIRSYTPGGIDESVSFNAVGQIEVRRSPMDPKSWVEIVAQHEILPIPWRVVAERSAGRWNIVIDGKENVSLAATDNSLLYLLVRGRAEFRIDSKREPLQVPPVSRLP
jgi:hypothetical protein